MGKNPDLIDDLIEMFENPKISTEPKCPLPERNMVGKFVLIKDVGENLRVFEYELMKLMGDFKEATGIRVSSIQLSNRDYAAQPLLTIHYEKV